jgi:murein DD-endopeptidase MepM/ murein hydrolase activator NlpD
VRILVLPDTAAGGGRPVAIQGSLAGQPLYFEPTEHGAWHALGGIPVNAQETIPLTLTISYPKGEPQHQFVRVPVRGGEFRVERLTVDRRFVEQPDAALQERIARERAAAGAVYRRALDTPRLWRGDFVRPAAGPVTSPFGSGREFNGQLQSRHLGVDLDGDWGDPVMAANRGIVELVGDFYYNGSVVYLNHGSGLVTAYLHLSRVEVAEGDTVNTGQLVGWIGASGRVTGPHLHWLVRYGRVSLDGLELLALDLSDFGEPLASAPPPPQESD